LHLKRSPSMTVSGPGHKSVLGKPSSVILAVSQLTHMKKRSHVALISSDLFGREKTQKVKHQLIDIIWCASKLERRSRVQISLLQLDEQEKGCCDGESKIIYIWTTQLHQVLNK
jgi:hypothetical protein